MSGHEYLMLLHLLGQMALTITALSTMAVLWCYMKIFNFPEPLSNLTINTYPESTNVASLNIECTCGNTLPCMYHAPLDLLSYKRNTFGSLDAVEF